MDRDTLLTHIKRLLEKAQNINTSNVAGVHAEVFEFLRIFAGPKSEFYSSLKGFESHLKGPEPRLKSIVADNIRAVLESFRTHVEAGLNAEVSPERKAQLDVMSDFLEQAHNLLESNEIHPAAPTVLVGAALEEFLRTWVEAEGISIENSKPSLDAYAKCLREADLITKQDYKDITSWAGLRNHAAHGEWDEVKDKNRISLMLEGVNLFMRKYNG